MRNISVVCFKFAIMILLTFSISCGKKEEQKQPEMAVIEKVETPEVPPEQKAFENALDFQSKNPTKLEEIHQLFYEICNKYPDTEWEKKALQKKDEIYEMIAGKVYRDISYFAGQVKNSDSGKNDAVEKYLSYIEKHKNTRFVEKAYEDLNNLIKKNIDISLSYSGGGNIFSIVLKAEISSKIRRNYFDTAWVVDNTEKEGNTILKYTFSKPDIYNVEFNITVLGTRVAGKRLSVNLSEEYCIMKAKEISNSIRQNVIYGEYHKARDAIGFMAGCGIAEITSEFEAFTSDINKIESKRKRLISALYAIYTVKDFSEAKEYIKGRIREERMNKRRGSFIVAVLGFELERVEKILDVYAVLPERLKVIKGDLIRLSGIKGNFVRCRDGAIELSMNNRPVKIPLGKLKAMEIEDLLYEYAEQEKTIDDLLGLSFLYVSEGDFKNANSKLRNAGKIGFEDVEKFNTVFSMDEMVYKSIDKGKQIEIIVAKRKKEEEKQTINERIRKAKRQVKVDSIKRNINKSKTRIDQFRREIVRCNNEIEPLMEQIKERRSAAENFKRGYLLGIEQYYDDWKRMEKEVKQVEKKIEKYKRKILLAENTIISEEKKLRKYKDELNKYQE